MTQQCGQSEGGADRASHALSGSFCSRGLPRLRLFSPPLLEEIPLPHQKEGKRPDITGFYFVIWERCLWILFLWTFLSIDLISGGKEEDLSVFYLTDLKKLTKQKPILPDINVICLYLCGLLCPIDLSAQV